MKTPEMVLSGETLDRLADVVLLIGLDGAILDANPAAQAFYGYSAERLQEMGISDLLAAEDAADPNDRSASTPEVGAVFETVHQRRDGTQVPVSILLVPVLVEAAPMLLLLLRDLTGRELASDVLVQERGTLAAVMESTDAGLIVSDPLGLDAVLDAAMLALFEFPSQEAYEDAVADGEAGWEASYPDGRTIPPYDRPLARAVRGDFVRNFDMRYRSPRTGNEWDCRLNTVPVRDADGAVTVIVQTLLDVTSSRAAEQERQRVESLLHDQAMTDELTGLANRRSFAMAARRELRRAVRVHRPLTVAAIDVDHLKAFNDDFGHAGGDEVLILLARTVTAAIRDIDLFARIGGDEFILLLADASAEQAYETVGRIRRDLQSNPLSWDGSNTCVSISAGVASLTDGETLEALLARADEALYEAKDSGRSRTELS